MRTDLIVALGDHLYAVDRPWGSIPERMRLGGLASVAVDSDDHVFVLQRRDPPVLVFDRCGDYLQSWGTGVITDGHAIFVGSGDRVLIADRDAHRVFVFDAGGNVELMLGEHQRPRFQAPFNHPTSAAFGRDGDIYVADGYGNSCVHWFSPDGKLERSWGRPGTAAGEFCTPSAVAVDRDGRVLVGDRENNRVQVFTREGEFVAEWSDVFRPMGIWVDRGGMIYVSDQTPRLSMFASDGTLHGRCRPVPYVPLNVWGNSRGDLYVPEAQLDWIIKLVRVAEG